MKKSLLKLAVSTMLITVVSVMTAMLLFTCKEASNGSDTSSKYVCANGTAASGDAPNADTTKCASCDDGFVQSGDACVTAYDFVCTNGMPASGSSTTKSTPKCGSYDDGFVLENETCR